MDEKEVQSFLIVSSVVLVLLAVTIILLFAFFQKRRNALLLEKKDSEKKFEREISRTQIEIREETLKNISWELHDNIGQLLVLAKIQLQSVPDSEAAQSTLSNCIRELRELSRLINPEAVGHMNLREAVSREIARLNRLNFINAEFEVSGEDTYRDSKVDIIFFRILQEFFSNTIKHARATRLQVKFEYGPVMLRIRAIDNGEGFDVSGRHEGIGLNNMKSRAQLVGAILTLDSETGKGTRLTITYPYPTP